MSESDNPAAWLEEPDGTRHVLQGTCGLGRVADNQIVIRDNGVSRHHANIQPQGKGEFWLFDLDSKNGTLVNGRRIVFPVTLQPGDKIQIGERTFIFQRTISNIASDEESDAGTDPTLFKILTEPCWLLIADLENSTQLARGKEPMEWAGILARWVGPCREIIEKGGGRIDKHVGDGFLAFWRVRDCAPDRVAGVVGSLRQFRAATEVPFRVVVHHGSVTFGRTLTPGEEIMPGDELNFIFRLEELAGKCGLDFCLSASAHPHLDPFLKLESVPGEHEIRGIEGRHSVFRLV